MKTVDHHRAPLLEAIAAYRRANMAPFSTPGHKQGSSLDLDFYELFGPDAFMSDIPLSGGADTVHFSLETLAQAELLGADAWGADKSFYLVNGSSTGNLAYLLATLKPGDEVIVSRDIHKSLMVALIHTGAMPVYVAPQVHPTYDVGLGVTPEAVERAIACHPAAKLVIIVSPSYCGVSSDLDSIARIAHIHDIPLFVDEAWGPHLGFHPDLPKSAMASGADGAVTSTHKVLGAFTQSAVLNIRGERVSRHRLASTVGMSQTTSPSTSILASIDACRRQMILHGRELLDETLDLANNARTRLAQIPGIGVLDSGKLGVSRYDPTKLVIDFHELGMTGIESEKFLRFDHGVCPEMSDATGVVCLITVGDTTTSIDRLVDACAKISRHARTERGSRTGKVMVRSSGTAVAASEQAMSPREAFYARSVPVPAGQAIGEISADLLIPYPPGIPVLAPGEVITAEKVEYLIVNSRIGTQIHGAVDHPLTTITIVDRPDPSG